MLPLLEHLDKEALASMTPGITHVDEPIFYTSFQENILLMIQADDASDVTDHKPALSAKIVFIDTPRLSLMSLIITIWSKRKRSFKPLCFFLT